MNPPPPPVYEWNPPSSDPVSLASGKGKAEMQARTFILSYSPPQTLKGLPQALHYSSIFGCCIVSFRGGSLFAVIRARSISQLLYQNIYIYIHTARHLVFLSHPPFPISNLLYP